VGLGTAGSAGLSFLPKDCHSLVLLALVPTC